MIFSVSFIKALDELSHQVEHERQELGINALHDVVELSVKAWCRKLNISDEIISYIRTWRYKTEFTAFIENVWFQHKSVNTNFINYTKTIFNMKQITNMNFIIFIAFVLTSVGFFLYQLRRSQSFQKEQKQVRGATVPAQQSALSPDKNKFVLVLIINAGKEDILQSLKVNGRVILNEGEILYRATQALWMGSETELLKSRLENGFSKNPLTQEVEESEYDIRFVKIEIYKPDPGFAPNANQLDRHDAFRNLPSNSKNVIVSPRLPSKAYENTDVYSR